MKVRTWKYPPSLWGAHWSRFVIAGEPALPLGYVSVDRDGSLELPGSTPNCAFVRTSSGGRGLHLRIPLGGLRLTPYNVFQLRELLQDDRLRLKMDAYRWKCTRDPLYLKGITFDRKKGKRAGPWVRAAFWRIRSSNRIPRLAARRVASGSSWRSARSIPRLSSPNGSARRVVAGRWSHPRKPAVSPALPVPLPWALGVQRRRTPAGHDSPGSFARVVIHDQ
jgi:hypothetical protein